MECSDKCVDFIFALISDIIAEFREIDAHLQSDEALRAFADDTGVVIADYVRSLPGLQFLFSAFAEISSLMLNIKKTIFILLWPGFSAVGLRRLLIEVCPAWRDIGIESSTKYPGFYLGPGAGERSWDKPLDKYVRRASFWLSTGLGMNLNLVIYRPFIASVLSFVMQLEPDVDRVQKCFEEVLRKLASGPGTWISVGDLCNLQSAYLFPTEFTLPRFTSLAAKLRVICTVAPECEEIARKTA